MTRNLLYVPDEIQLKILAALDRSSLACLSLVNKSLSAKATPILWRHIELEADLDDLHLAQRFFNSCDSFLNDRSERWQELASLVRSLKIGSLPGIAIPNISKPYQEGYPDRLAWVGQFNDDRLQRSIYDIIFRFANLEELHLYIGEPWDADDAWGFHFKPDYLRVPKLKRLSIGGCIHKDVLQALLDSSERLEEFSCFYPQETTADQGCGPPLTVFLNELQPRFASLTIVHLCKLAHLAEFDDNVRFIDIDNDRAILEDWAGFLKNVSGSIISLTLEDRYYKPSQFDGYNHSLFSGKGAEGVQGDWSRDVRERFQEILLPVIVDESWPKLQTLILVGMDVEAKNKKATEALEHLRPQVEIQFERAKLVDWNYDATPLIVDPPDGYFFGR